MTYFALYIVSVTQLPIISRTIVLNDPLQLLKLQPGKKMLFDTHKRFFRGEEKEEKSKFQKHRVKLVLKKMK